MRPRVRSVVLRARVGYNIIVGIVRVLYTTTDLLIRSFILVYYTTYDDDDDEYDGNNATHACNLRQTSRM